MFIEKTIHQVWEGRTEPKLPTRLALLAETWKEQNPDWEYHLWNGEEMDELVSTHFPEYLNLYKSFSFNVQRWDMIRYMILYLHGGVYTDLDTECFKSIDPLFENKSLCFGEEPPEHNLYQRQGITQLVGNAFLASTQKNEAWLHLMKEIEKATAGTYSENIVLNTTGPLIITRNIDIFKSKYNASILPFKDVTPISKPDLIFYATGKNTSGFTKKIENAYCAHYFFGSWEKKYSIY